MAHLATITTTLLLSASLQLGFSACNNQKKATNTTTTRTFTKPVEPRISYMQMRRTSCYGKCPTYNIEMYEGGQVRFTGIRFVEPLGVYEKKFDVQKIKALLQQFQQARVDTMKDSYNVGMTDAPDVFYTFTIDGKTKEITNAMFGPIVIKELALQVDQVIGKPDFSWFKVSDKAPE